MQKTGGKLKNKQFIQAKNKWQNLKKSKNVKLIKIQKTWAVTGENCEPDTLEDSLYTEDRGSKSNTGH